MNPTHEHIDEHSIAQVNDERRLSAAQVNDERRLSEVNAERRLDQHGDAA